jgi:hypothetical protein
VTTWSDRFFGGADPFGLGDLKDRSWFRPLCGWLIAAEAIGLVIASSYVLHAWDSGASWPGEPLLIVPAGLLLFSGQITAIVALFGERREGSSTRRKISWDFVTHGDVRVYALQVVMLAIFYLSIFQAQSVTSSPNWNEGDPAPPTSGCPWPLDSHGSITCVSHPVYVAAGTGLQRFAAGVILGFFAFQLAVLIGFISKRPTPVASST